MPWEGRHPIVAAWKAARARLDNAWDGKLSRAFQAARLLSSLHPGHRPAASALGSVLPARWAERAGGAAPGMRTFQTPSYIHLSLATIDELPPPLRGSENVRTRVSWGWQKAPAPGYRPLPLSGQKTWRSEGPRYSWTGFASEPIIAPRWGWRGGIVVADPARWAGLREPGPLARKD